MPVFSVAEHAVLLAQAALRALGTSGNVSAPATRELLEGESRRYETRCGTATSVQAELCWSKTGQMADHIQVSVQGVVCGVGVHAAGKFRGKLRVTSGVLAVEI